MAEAMVSGSPTARATSIASRSSARRGHGVLVAELERQGHEEVDKDVGRRMRPQLRCERGDLLKSAVGGLELKAGDREQASGGEPLERRELDATRDRERALEEAARRANVSASSGLHPARHETPIGADPEILEVWLAELLREQEPLLGVIPDDVGVLIDALPGGPLEPPAERVVRPGAFGLRDRVVGDVADEDVLEGPRPAATQAAFVELAHEILPRGL